MTTMDAARGAGRCGERGSVSLEVIVLAPALLLLMALLGFAGRIAMAEGVVDRAAVEAARAASLQRSAAAGQREAARTVEALLRDQGLTCADVAVAVDTAGFEVPVGRPAHVDVAVRCRVRVLDLGDFSPVTVSATAVSPLDTYRERR